MRQCDFVTAPYYQRHSAKKPFFKLRRVAIMNFGAIHCRLPRPLGAVKYVKLSKGPQKCAFDDAFRD